jgi:hypothetical protein
MSNGTTREDELKPRKAVRRFDVFAEYNRRERLNQGFPEDEAKGYGIWLAKVVAARRFGSKSNSHQPRPDRLSKGAQEVEPKFRSVGDELQTDETFDHDIIARMGREFYSRVFVPAIADAISAGKSYESIRDDIRKEWKPEKGR